MGYYNKLSIIGILFVLCLFSGCENTENRSKINNNNNQKKTNSAAINLIPEPCIATFTHPYSVINMFDKEIFSITAGESFIMKGFFFPKDLYYVTDKGAYGFRVEKMKNGVYPFTTNCTEKNTTMRLGVFHKTIVYSDEDLSQIICTLERGMTASSCEGQSGFRMLGNSIYKVYLNDFSAQCKGAEIGYIVAIEANINNHASSLVPIRMYRTPVTR